MTVREMNKDHMFHELTPKIDGSLWVSSRGFLSDCVYCDCSFDSKSIISHVGYERLCEEHQDLVVSWIDTGMEHDDHDPIYTYGWLQYSFCPFCRSDNLLPTNHINVFGGYHDWHGEIEFFKGFGPWFPYNGNHSTQVQSSFNKSIC